MKIAMQKGYPDSDGKVHDLLIDAQKSESNIQLLNAIEKDGGGEKTKLFIQNNADLVTDFIKYNVKKKKKTVAAAAKSKSTASKGK